MQPSSKVSSKQVVYLAIFAAFGFSLGHAMRPFLSWSGIIPLAAIAAFVAVLVLQRIR